MLLAAAVFLIDGRPRALGAKDHPPTRARAGIPPEGGIRFVFEAALCCGDGWLYASSWLTRRARADIIFCVLRSAFCVLRSAFCVMGVFCALSFYPSRAAQAGPGKSISPAERGDALQGHPTTPTRRLVRGKALATAAVGPIAIGVLSVGALSIGVYAHAASEGGIAIGRQVFFH